MKKNNKYIFYGFVSLIQICIVFLLCQLYINNTNEKLVTYIQEITNDRPVIKVLDLKEITTKLLAEGLSTAEVAEYGDLYIQILNKQGVLVIKASTVITYDNRKNEPLPSLDVVRKTAKEMGIEPEKDYQKILDESPISKLYKALLNDKRALGITQ